MRRFWTGLAVLSAITFGACGVVSDAPADHTKSEDGVMHARGSNDSCTSCHGAGLQGPACSDCHRNLR